MHPLIFRRDDYRLTLHIKSPGFRIRINLSYLIRIRIRIQIVDPDPDPGGQK